MTPHVNTARLQLLVSTRSLGIPNRKLLWLCLTKHSLRTWIGITELAAMDSMGSYQLSIGPVHTKLGRVSNAKGNWWRFGHVELDRCEAYNWVVVVVVVVVYLFACRFTSVITTVALRINRCKITKRHWRTSQEQSAWSARGRWELRSKDPQKLCRVLTAS